MGRRAIGVFTSFLAVAFLAVGGWATAEIAFIGYYDTWGADDVKALLGSQGYATTIVQLCDVGTTDLSGFDLLIVGRDTGDYGEWGNQAGRDAIRALEVPILGIYDGGGSLFDQLGVDISCMATATFDEPGMTSMIVENTGHPILRMPNDLSVSDGDSLQLYTEPCPVSALYVPPLPGDVVAFGRLQSDTDYAPVALQGKYAYWGFKFTPYDMTQDGKDLFLNIIAYLLGETQPDRESGAMSVREVNVAGQQWVGLTVEIEGVFVSDPVPMLVSDLDLVLRNQPLPENDFMELELGDLSQELSANRYGGATIVIAGKVYHTPEGRLGVDVDAFRVIGTIPEPYAPTVVDTPRIEPSLVTEDRYAVLFSGGWSKQANYTRYWNDLTFMYSTLVNKYHYSPGNIVVLYGDGTPLKAGQMPVHYAGTQKNLESVFASAKSRLDQDDPLFVFITNHGSGFETSESHSWCCPYDSSDSSCPIGRFDSNGDEQTADIQEKDYGTTACKGLDLNGNGTKTDTVKWDESLCAWGEEHIFDDDLRAMLSGLTCSELIVVMETCFSGGLIWDLRGTNRILISAAGEHEPSWCLVSGKYSHDYDEFSFHFTAALNEAEPDGTVVDADANKDGAVSIMEAFNYARAKDTRPETPHYEDSGDGVPHTGNMPAGGEGTLGSNTDLK